MISEKHLEVKNINCVFLCLMTAASLVAVPLARADSVLEFQLKKNRASSPTNQSVAIKDGQVIVKAAGGNKEIDLLYSRAEEKVVIVDHRKKTVMSVDEQQVTRINQQAKEVQPLLQGVSEQIAKLSHEQRQKWQELLGESVSLDKMAQAAVPPEPIRMVLAGVTKVAGIRCQKMWAMQGTTPMAEVCLAEADALKLPADDNTTLRALLGFYEKLAAKSQKTARQFGLSLPILGSPNAEGIPIKMLDLSRDENGSLTLSRIKTSTVAPELMQIPSGYKAEPLALWP